MYYDENRISTNCKSAWFSESGNTDVNMKSPTNIFFLKSQEELQILMNQSHKVAVYAVAMLHCISLPLGAKSNQKYITQTKNSQKHQVAFTRPIQYWSISCMMR